MIMSMIMEMLIIDNVNNCNKDDNKDNNGTGNDITSEIRQILYGE